MAEYRFDKCIICQLKTVLKDGKCLECNRLEAEKLQSFPDILQELFGKKIYE